MKKIISALLLVSFAFQSHAFNDRQTVNRIIGDISFFQTFHRNPGATTNEQVRIKTHLAYVQRLLWQANVSQLTAQQQSNRAKALTLLQQYIVNGQFPLNEKYPGERKSCFIDSRGNICAVGYLIEKTAGRSVAEAINQKFQYDYITDMNDPTVTKWADDFGFTIEECAMIQPTYQPLPPDDPYTTVLQRSIKPSQGITSSLMVGVNAGIMLTNLSSRNNRFAKAGLFTGAAQIIFGVASVKKEKIHRYINGPSYRESFKAANTLSYVNIATGAATMVTSFVNMTMNKKRKCNKNAVGVYSYPDINNKLNVGMSFVRAI